MKQSNVSTITNYGLNFEQLKEEILQVINDDFVLYNHISKHRLKHVSNKIAKRVVILLNDAE
jgi:hypothetical protein